MIRSLTSLRFPFVMLIVLFHFVGPRFEWGGDCGNAFFFMLSGFVLSHAYGQKVVDGSFSTLPFLIRQLLKFYPLHLLILIVVVVLDARIGVHYAWWQLLPSFMLLQSWFPFHSVVEVANSASWFLCALLCCYVVFSCGCKFIMRASRRRLLAVSAVLLAAYGLVLASVTDEKVEYVVCLWPPMRVLNFLLGVVLFRFCSSEWGGAFASRLRSSASWKVSVAEAASLLLVPLSFLAYSVAPHSVRCVSLFWLFSSPLVVVLYLADGLGGVFSALLNSRILFWLGGISFEIYLSHCLVGRIADGVLRSSGLFFSLPAAALFAVHLSAMIPAAYALHRWFVTPVRQRLSAYLIK